MYLYLVAIAWVYVVLLMSATEQSVTAGVMTFLLYCVLPLSIILYVMGTAQRRRKRHMKDNSGDASKKEAAAPEDTVDHDTAG